MAHDARGRRGESDAATTASAPAPKIGAFTLVQRLESGTPGAEARKVGAHTLTQLLGGGPSAELTPGALHHTAAMGVAGSGGALPHLDEIQRSFGRHDVSGIEAHVGGSAAPATRALGTEAYATGNRIAFAGAPSLHTAAHEAAHVIQQRAGVQLKGGIGRAGDVHEQHADAVADMVVQGRSAEALLDSYRDRGGGGGIQAKGGDISGTPVLPRFRSEPSEHRTVMEALPPGERDADHNDKTKVALENALASWVVTHNSSFFEPVKALSASIAKYLELRQEHIGASVEASLKEQYTVDASLKALYAGTSTYGRIAAEEAAYPEQLKALLAGGGSLHEHLLVQQMFIDKIYNKDANRIIKELADKFAELIKQPMEANALKPPKGAIDIGIGSTTYESGHDNARTEQKGSVAGVATGGLGPHNPDVHGAGDMMRGTDRFTAVENNAFVQSARLILDMPVSGTGLSGSATDLFACAKLLGFAGDRGDYALAAFSFFAKAGAHTFHEVMLMAKAAGFNAYVPGNYISAIPEPRRAAVRLDLATYSALLADPTGAATVTHAADSKLHGWNDTMELDGDVAGWADKIKAFIATRFGVAADAVTIKAITDGRSGDMVYQVDVLPLDKPPFKGIFKIFHDADVADTEVQIGDKMKEQGVRTPGNRGMARIETGAGKPSKAGVLFDHAGSDSVHAMVVKIGKVALDAPERPALIEALEKAVKAVAVQLATLHGKTEASKVARAGVPTELAKDQQMATDVKRVHEKGLYQAHLEVARANGRFKDEVEGDAVDAAFNTLAEDNLVKQKLRKSMTHGDANSGNFVVDRDNVSIIDVNTGVQSIGPKGFMKTGASDTGRFLETLRTSSPGALTEPELSRLDQVFHDAYLPGTAAFSAKLPEGARPPSRAESNALKKVDDEKAADEKAEVYYRACWILNQLSHADDKALQRTMRARLLVLIPALAGKLDPAWPA